MNKENYEKILSEALAILRGGGVILYPTDTVWGLGCDATNPSAVAKVYELKKRSDSKSLVLLASDMDMVARFVERIPDIAIDLVEVNDRPMTIIYPGAVVGNGDRFHLAQNVVAEDGSVGIRIPMNDFCKDLVRKLGRPLVSTSANISGEPTPKTFKDIGPEIKSGADYVVAPSLGAGATGSASQIIKLGLDGEVEIIRK